MTAPVDVDRGALLSALVLAPTTFARNRFFTLFTETTARRTRSRATQLRTIVRHLAHEKPRAKVLELTLREDGSHVLRYGIESLKLLRTSVLGRLELALVRFGLSRRPQTGTEPLAPMLHLTPEDRALVVASIAKLGDKLELPFSLDENSPVGAAEEYHPSSTQGDS
ncbi:MAG: hypothetical protein ABW133_12810 [Polyangiaceae bacterium]